MAFDVDTQYKKKLDAWFEHQILAHLESWQQDARPQVRKLIASLNEHQLLTPGWPEPWGDNDINQQLYLHYRIAQQPIGGLGLCLASHLDIGGRLLQRYGSNLHQEAWLPKSLTGECLLALAMTERNAGSDIQGIETYARKTAYGWCLTGHKANITNGADADLAIVLARTQTGRSPLSYALFLVPLNSPGVSRHDHYDLLGYQGCLGGFDLNNVELPEDALIGIPGQGLITLLKHLDFERLLISARIAGYGKFLLEQQLTELRKRKTFGKPLINRQAAAFEHAHLWAEWAGYQAHTEQLAKVLQAGKSATRETAMLKLNGSRLLVETADRFIQWSGGRGYMEYHIAARAYCESPGLALAGGSEETLINVIARDYL